MKAGFCLCLAAGLAMVAQAQTNYTPYTFITLAGGGEAGSADGPGSEARFSGPHGIAVDTAGTIYVADTYNNTIRKISPAGVVSTLAGSPGVLGSADGTGSDARFNQPWTVAVDAAGNLYVTDNGNETIRKITAGGEVGTFAGQVGEFGSADGAGSEALFWFATGVAVDADGSVYVADSNNNTIRKISPDAVVTTLAGRANGYVPAPGSEDGAGSAARFHRPNGVAVDGAGDVYVADYANHTIRKITPEGVVNTVAGQAPESGNVDATGNDARLNHPTGVAVDSAGNVYVAEFIGNTIRKITPDGVVTTLAGLAETPGSTDGTGSAARFNGPYGIAVDTAGNLYVVEYWGRRVKKGWPAEPPKLGKPVASPDGSVEVTLTGAAGSRYTLQSSSNLVDWVPLTDCVSTNDTITLTAPAATDSPVRFYRAVLQ